MKKMSLVLSALLISNIALAEHHNHGKSQDAHVHGALKMEMAVEGKTIDIDIDGPAESFIGFEYAPKTAKEKKTFADAEALWTKELLTKLFILDAKLGCKVTEASFKQEVEDHKENHKEHHKDHKKEAGVHSDIEAEAKITCTGDLKGQNLTVNLKKHYSHIKKLVVDLVGSEVKSIEINQATQAIKL